MKKHESKVAENRGDMKQMNEAEKKRFVIKTQQQIIRDYQMKLAQAGVKLPTDESTRRKEIEDFIHNENLLKEKTCRPA